MVYVKKLLVLNYKQLHFKVRSDLFWMNSQKFLAFYSRDEWLITGSFLFVQEIFFFKEGSVIFWNVPELERNLVLKFLAKHSEDAYEEDIGRVAFHCFFLYIKHVESKLL